MINANLLTILDEATYVPEEEALIHPCTIPVMESSLGVWKIPYQPLNELCENHGTSLLDAFISVCECNQIDPSTVVMSVDEADIIEYPELIDESVPFVVAPISHYDPIYQLCEAVIDRYMETLDDSLLEAFDVNSKMTGAEIMAALGQYGNERLGSMAKKMIGVTSNSEREAIRKDTDARIGAAADKAKDAIRRRQAQLSSKSAGTLATDSAVSNLSGSLTGNSDSNPVNSDANSVSQSGDSGFLQSKTLRNLGFVGAGAAIGAALHKTGHNPILMYRNRPKSVIAKKIASLRKLYAKTMHRFQNASDSGIKNRLKQVAGKILGIIDKLMAYLQKKAN